MIPGKTHQPADYPRVPPIELDRQVEAKDMSDFFVSELELQILDNI